MQDGAKQVFQSTLVGDPGTNPMDLLPLIPEKVKIGAIWGDEDFATPQSSPIAQTIKEQAETNPERFSWKLIHGGHVLYDDCPEEVTNDMVKTFSKWF